MAGHQRKPACRGRTLRPPEYLGFRPRRTRAGRCRTSGNLMFPCCYNPSNASSRKMEGGNTPLCEVAAGSGWVVPPLRNLRVLRLLPDYRFRFMIVPKGSFFSILPVFPVMPQRPVAAGQTQLVAGNTLAATFPTHRTSARIPIAGRTSPDRTVLLPAATAQAVPKMPTKRGKPAKQGKMRHP